MDFQWLQSAFGGVMIGAAALLLYASAGRIAGISGIVYGLAQGDAGRGWRLSFLAGLLGGGWLAAHLVGTSASAPLPTTATVLTLIGAGLLVGVGTRLGNGCTSGHGICGLSRLSPRSLAATAVFMAAGMALATLLRFTSGG